ncbi:MAG: MFS transporter, partial [Planctomycetes bacterium]|nr:MFS transporter [Planctomycetota bacterium]
MPSAPSTPAESRVRKDLNASVADGVGASVMIGLGESYVSAFALAVGTGEVVAGLLSTVPLLAGAVLQLIGPRAVARVGSLRRWVMACAALQALAFAPLVGMAVSGWASTPLLFVVMTLYWAGGFAAGTAWNAWMDVLVPGRLRPTFFALRSRTCHVATLAALIVAGGVLQLGDQLDAPTLGFAALFAGSGLARLASVWFLGRQREVAAPARSGAPLRQTLRGPAGGLLAYMLALQFAVWLAVPYFTPFMLDHLHLSYAEFTSIAATSFFARIVALPLIGRLVRRAGARRLLLLAVAGIVPQAGLWALSGWLPYLLFLQLVGGVVWAAYELTTFLLVFQTIPHAQRVTLLTWYNLASAAAIMAGSLLGGGLLALLGTDASAYLIVFLASTGLRLVTAPILLLFKLEPVRELVPLPSRTLSIRPGTGALVRPVVAADPAP